MLKHNFINILKLATDAKKTSKYDCNLRKFLESLTFYSVKLKKFEKIENELFQQPKERVFLFILSIFVYRIYFFKSINGYLLVKQSRNEKQTINLNIPFVIL